MRESGKRHNKYIGPHKYHEIGTNVNIQNKTKKKIKIKYQNISKD